jgi:prepilin signal peptidase PulO-like enzyme (type II secretory pathway)
METLLTTIPLGIILGIFINYACDVLPIKRNLVKPVCRHCHETLGWKDYFFSPRCTICNTAFSIRRYLLLLITPAIVSWLWFVPPERFSVWVGVILITYSLIIMIIDIENRAILSSTIFFGATIFLVLGVYLHGSATTLSGGAAGFLIMFLLQYFGSFFTQWLARRRGELLEEPALGFGDVNLTCVLGFGLGWPGVAAGLVIAFLLGGLTGLVYLIITKISGRFRAFQAMPYAPFLILAAMYLLFR